MHYLETGQYTYLAGEINALYHEAAVKMGISDSVQNILYVLCEKDGNACKVKLVSLQVSVAKQSILLFVNWRKKESSILNKGKAEIQFSVSLERERNFRQKK